MIHDIVTNEDLQKFRAQLLEDLIVTAANQALTQAKEMATQEMGKVTSGFSLPGMV